MRIFNLLAPILFLTPFSHGAGGDVIGGGSLRQLENKLQLSKEEIKFLKKYDSNKQKFNIWINSLNPREQRYVFKKVFQGYVAPQLAE